MPTVFRLRVSLVASLACIAFGVHAHGDHGDHGKGADRGESRPRDGLASSAAFDANGTLWAVAKGGHHVVLRNSTDLGKTWSWGMAVNLEPEPVGAEAGARPRIAVGPGGELYVSWTPPVAGAHGGRIRFARSLDRNSFSAPITVHADRREVAHRFSAMTVDRDGRIFIAWAEAPKASPGKRAPSAQAAARFAVSSDRGQSFRGDFDLGDRGCPCCGVALSAHGDGSVASVWPNAPTAKQGAHALVRLHADGRAEGVMQAASVKNAAIACQEDVAALGEGPSGRLHAVWATRGGALAGVHYGRLREGGVEGARRFGNATAAQPDLAMNGNRIAVTWTEVAGTRSELFGMRSDDGGSTWQGFTVAGIDGEADRPQLLHLKGRFFVYWNTRAAPHAIHPLP